MIAISAKAKITILDSTNPLFKDFLRYGFIFICHHNPCPVMILQIQDAQPNCSQSHFLNPSVKFLICSWSQGVVFEKNNQSKIRATTAKTRYATVWMAMPFIKL